MFPYLFPRDLKDLVKYAFNLSPEAHYHLNYLPKVAPWLFRYWRNSTADGAKKILKANLPLIENCLSEHQALADEAGASELIRKIGWIRLFRTEKRFAQAQREAERTLPYGVRYDVLSAEEIRAREPHLSTEIIGGVHQLDPASVSDPHALTVAYLTLFEKLGGRFVTGDARSLSKNGTGWSVKTDEGETDARDCVVALGPWSGEIFRKLGYSIPLEIKRGYHMHFKPKGNAVLNRPVLDVERGYLIAPMARGIRLTTGAEFASMDAPKTPVQLEQTEPVARSLFPLDGRVDAEPWMGRRPCLPDMTPVIGPAPRHQGLWFAFGHQHHGLTNAAVTGRLIADLVTGSKAFIDPTPYRADRF